MGNESFTYFEIVLIRNNVGTKTIKEIAALLNKPLDDVSDFVLAMARDEGLTLFGKESEKEKLTPAKVKPENKEASIISRNIEVTQEQKRRKNNSPQYKTKQVDYSKLICVKVNDKTSIYVNPDADIEAEKRRCLESLNKTKEDFLPKRIVAKNENTGHFGELKKKRNLLVD